MSLNMCPAGNLQGLYNSVLYNSSFRLVIILYYFKVIRIINEGYVIHLFKMCIPFNLTWCFLKGQGIDLGFRNLISSKVSIPNRGRAVFWNAYSEVYEDIFYLHDCGSSLPPQRNVPIFNKPCAYPSDHLRGKYNLYFIAT